MPNYVIIVAGGKGNRMGGNIPKQFLPLGDKPILMRTIEKFYRYDTSLGIILVLPASQTGLWTNLCHTHRFDIPFTLVNGGESRFQSVKNGLEAVRGSGLVGVHDGVRPFVSVEVIKRCYDLAAEKKTAVPVIDIVETLRHVSPKDHRTVNRAEYKLVQTPQVFDVELLKTAYSQPFSEGFTDDASVVEAMGVKIHLTQGNRENIKITTPYDLKIGSALI